MTRRAKLVVTGIIAAVAISMYTIQAWAIPELKPWCSNPPPMSTEKLRLLKEKCAWGTPSANTHRTPVPPVLGVYSMETATGILNESMYVNTPLAKGKYVVSNVWASTEFAIYAVL
jgi:hypothetical protein